MSSVSKRKKRRRILNTKNQEITELKRKLDAFKRECFRLEYGGRHEEVHAAFPFIKMLLDRGVEIPEKYSELLAEYMEHLTKERLGMLSTRDFTVPSDFVTTTDYSALEARALANLMALSKVDTSNG